MRDNRNAVRNMREYVDKYFNVNDSWTYCEDRLGDVERWIGIMQEVERVV
jgi:hypothetical protein